MTWSHAPLRHDIRYYTTVTACNAVDQCSQMTSDGVMIDVTPPVTGLVWDGDGDEEITHQSQRSAGRFRMTYIPSQAQLLYKPL